MLLDNNTKKVFDLIDMYDNLNNVDKVRLAIYLLENKNFYINFNIKDIIILLKEVLNKLDSGNSKNIVNVSHERFYLTKAFSGSNANEYGFMTLGKGGYALHSILYLTGGYGPIALNSNFLGLNSKFCGNKTDE